MVAGVPVKTMADMGDPALQNVLEVPDLAINEVFDPLLGNVGHLFFSTCPFRTHYTHMKVSSS